MCFYCRSSFPLLSGESGPSHNRVYEAAVKIRGWEFKGLGPTKKRAKCAAAEVALEYLSNIHNVGPHAANPPFAEGSGTLPEDPKVGWDALRVCIAGHNYL